MAIGIYKLTDQNGKPIVLYVPRFSGNTPLPGTRDIYYSILSATEEFPEQFDHTVTFFARYSSTYNYMTSKGFPNVVLCSQHVNDTWTFENGAYIKFTTDNVTLYTKSGSFVSFGGYTDAITLISDKPNVNWNSMYYAYNGALEKVIDNGHFTFELGDYPSTGVSKDFFDAIWEGNTPFEPITDPYDKGGSSDTGGGTGNFDGTSEDIGIPDLPSMSAVDTGFITLFNPSASELKNLASYLWGDVFDVSTWKKIFADPMDAILGLSIVPVNVPSAGAAPVTIGNISTGVSMTKASSQYVSVDCGTINVNEYWGAYLDYSPYTKAEIYLPFIGTHPVTIDDIMGKPVHVVYHIDVLSGACCAYVQCSGTVLYSFVGQCSCSIPITANDWTNVINGALSIAGSIGTMVATGGATAPMAVTNIASTAVNSLKPDVEKSGSMGGMGGMLGVQKPYIILTRPRQALPERQNTFTGYPSFITKKLSDCSGYTEVESIHLENVPATQNELDEITELLKSGVII